VFLFRGIKSDRFLTGQIRRNSLPLNTFRISTLEKTDRSTVIRGTVFFSARPEKQKPLKMVNFAASGPNHFNSQKPPATIGQTPVNKRSTFGKQTVKKR
jgi:hypothetical protein